MDLLSLLSSDTLFDLLLENTYLILGSVILLSSSGLPLPTDLFIIASAALAANGYTNLAVVILIATFAATIGDNVAFLIGGRIRKIQHRLPGFLTKIIKAGESSFKSCDGRMIFLSRFLFTPLCTPISFLAGASKCSQRQFILLGLPGEFFWASEMAVVGYFFGQYIEIIYELVANLSIVTVLLLGIWVVAKRAR
ncbi:MAG: VTT domain-containing protein [Candidatus Altiarchaeota archaeon]